MNRHFSKLGFEILLLSALAFWVNPVFPATKTTFEQILSDVKSFNSKKGAISDFGAWLAQYCNSLKT